MPHFTPWLFHFLAQSIKNRRITALTLIMFCSLSCSPSPPVSSLMFEFDPHTVTEVTLGAFPRTSEPPWITVLQKKEFPNPLKKGVSQVPLGNWQFTSLPSLRMASDRKANATWIMHLLDALRQVKKIAPAPNGTLESLGLNPPEWVLKWKTEDHQWTLQIGSPAELQKGTYVTLDGKSAWIAQGSALRLLNTIQSFDDLRDPNWSVFSSDDVDELSFLEKGKTVFYAQREGDRWTDAQHQDYFLESSLHPGKFLQAITQAQPLKLVDSPAQITEFEKQWRRGQSLEIQLTNRFGVTSRLRLLRSSSPPPLLFGLSSLRPGLAFAFEPKLLFWMKSVQNTPRKKARPLRLRPSAH
ncbi:MAG: DUF4340 domain-containing protein [Bdellovibrionia bacterium]